MVLNAKRITTTKDDKHLRHCYIVKPLLILLRQWILFGTAYVPLVAVNRLLLQIKR